MDQKLLKRYLNNQCSDDELMSALSWFDKSADSSEGRELLHRFWDEINTDEADTAADFEAILNSIHHKVNLQLSGKLAEKNENDLVKYSGKQNFIMRLRNVAAILLFPVLGLGLFYSLKYYSEQSSNSSLDKAYNEVFSSVDAITKVSLPDGTKVWLNHSSSLRYPASFRGISRRVELKGEGYFEVAHNAGSKFIVNTGEIDVVAIGTTFNVMAYPDENKVETSLIEGRVDLQKPAGKKSITIYEMKPADMAVYYKDNGTLYTRTFNDDRYFSWKEGKLVFTAEPMAEVVKKLGRWFNAEIGITDPEVCDLTITATFVNESLLQVLDLLSIVSPVNYTISDRDINSDGTYEKRQVSLSYKKKNNNK